MEKGNAIGRWLKTYEELNVEEKKALILPCTATVEDYKTFAVDYNKKGELCRIVGHEFSDERKKQLDSRGSEPTIIDIFKVASGKVGKRQLRIFTKEDRRDIKSVIGRPNAR